MVELVGTIRKTRITKPWRCIADTGQPPNAEAPQLVRKEAKAPPRATKGFYIQELHSMAFDRLVFEQKHSGIHYGL
jgi:hypothetical protein